MNKIVNILFVCTGNICRSPFAEWYLKKKLESLSIKNFSVASAGTHAIKGNVPTENSLKAANELEIDLSRHFAQPVTVELLKSADFILVMEEIQRNYLQSLFASRPNIRLLGSFLPNMCPTGEIEDPIGQQLFSYRAAYRLIILAVDKMFETLFRIPLS